jgi:thiamine-phosphate diphosphorylase / hydroxyethylthiazole kinase
MATARQEMEDLTVVSEALLINFGTITDIESMKIAGHWMNRRGKPIVFDPVGVGATGYRRSSADGDIHSNQDHMLWKTEYNA